MKTKPEYMVRKDAKEVLNHVLSIFLTAIVQACIQNVEEENILQENIIQAIKTFTNEDSFIEYANQAVGEYEGFEGSSRTSMSKKAGLSLSTITIKKACIHAGLEANRLPNASLVFITGLLESFLSNIIEEVVPKIKNKKEKDLIRAVDIVSISDIPSSTSKLLLKMLRLRI